MNENGGNFKIAFWVLTVITTIGLVGIVNAVIANDRIRAVSDERIIEKMDTKFDMLQKAMIANQIEMITRMARIETKLEIK